MKEKILKLEGKKVDITYRNALDVEIQRKGILVIEQDWAYVYDEGKTGNEYNGAFCLQKGHIEKIVAITEL